ncbi:MAG: galactokinase [Actinomycetia bacterium]|nr:galactokinase [Actinomycetes bacterium]
MSTASFPVARWFAPGRVNLIGEHTDYNAGFALPLATVEGCLATVTPWEEASVRIRSTAFPEPVRVSVGELDPALELPPSARWARYPLGVLWALVARGHLTPDRLGCAIDLDSDVPVGSGLSSSAALICSTAGAVDDALGLALDRDELLAITRSAENDFVGAPTGGLDQLAALRARDGHALLCDMRSLVTEDVPFDPSAVGLRLLVVYTGTAHGHVDNEYRLRRATCERAARALGVPALREATVADTDRLADPLLRRRARHVVTENARVLAVAELLRADRLAEIGPLLTESHFSMRDDFEISAPAVDAAAETLLRCGALGARLTGGGFGGCVIALIEPDRIDAAVAETRRVARQRGFTEPTWFVERAGPAAHPVAPRTDARPGSDGGSAAGARAATGAPEGAR